LALALGGAAIAVYALFDARTASVSPLLDIALSAAGLVAFLAYAALRVWATLYLGGNKDRELQTAGPYSLCRNPLYVASLCLGIALAGSVESLALLAAVFAAAVLYVPIVIVPEEKLLAERFGDVYRSYCERTPRLWPRLAGFHTASSVAVDMERLGKEARRVGRAAVAIILLEALYRLAVLSR
jgi:protein-S-isoprenylcysteine O-methyltransferase Ste14